MKPKTLKIPRFNTYDREFKQKVILYAEQRSTREAQRKYGIPESNVRRWRRLKDTIFAKDAAAAGSSVSVIKKKDKKKKHSKNSKKSDQKRAYHQIENVMLIQDYEFNNDSSSLDSVPLTQRIASTSSNMAPSSPVEQQLHSQPLSPTKLKVTRQQIVPKPSKFQPIAPKPSENLLARAASEEVCLRWNSHHNNMQTSFPHLLKKEQFVDVTLVAEGQFIKCHRVILSSCSSYFEKIFDSIDHNQHPVIFLKDIPYWVMKSLTDFMYVGEVNIVQSKLQELLEAAEILKIKGLAGKSNTQNTTAQKTVPESPKHFEKPARPSQPPVLEPQVKPIPKPLVVKRVSDEDRRIATPSYVKPAVLPIEQLPITDPLALLEPTYQEETRRQEEVPAVLKQREHVKTVPKKTIGKKLRKRKGPEIDESQIPLRMRRGTRSRPNVKVPRYFHNFETTVESDPLMNTSTSSIKSEPIDEEFEPEVQEARSPTPPPRTIRRIVRTAENNEDVLITGIEADRVMLVTNSDETQNGKTIVPFMMASQDGDGDGGKGKELQDEDPEIMVEVEERNSTLEDDETSNNDDSILEIDDRDQGSIILEEKPDSPGEENEHQNVMEDLSEEGTRDTGMDIEETVIQNMDNSTKKHQEEETKEITNLQITDVVSLNEEENTKDVVLDKAELEEVINKKWKEKISFAEH